MTRVDPENVALHRMMSGLLENHPPYIVIPIAHREVCEAFFADIREGKVPGPSRKADAEEWQSWLISKRIASGEIQVVYSEDIPLKGADA